ncbi:glycosyltransferase [bacterium]|nr:glycosyltransferase [bacterium]
MITMVITTYNEAGNIGDLVRDITGQSRVPDELLIVDGGSTDGTVAEINEAAASSSAPSLKVRVIVEQGANVPEGRNMAIGAASHECVCVTDAGCRLDSEWCERITSPILQGNADMVGGFYQPRATSRFQRVLASITTRPEPGRSFLPSSRSIAFTKSLWERVGGYPEWLRWGEDTLFNETCIESGARYVVAPDAIVGWEVRPNLRAVVKQFFNYARGDGQRCMKSAAYAADILIAVVALAILAAGRVWGLLIPIFYAGLILSRHPSQVPLNDLPAALGLAVVIRTLRAAGFVVGAIDSRCGVAGRDRDEDPGAGKGL